MSRSMRTYYYAVAGAMGGLIAWRASDLVGLSFTRNLYLNEVIVGALIGLCIGLMIGATEGMVTLSLRRAARSALYAAPIGMLAGALALPLSEVAFQALGGEALARVLGWSLFGLMIGLAEGVTGRTQSWKGALGGALGGALLVAAQLRLDNPVLGKALGLVVLGACIGAFIALISVLLSRAWLQVVSGKLRGAEFVLDKYLRAGGPSAILGSDALKADIALPDPDISPQHALLSSAGTHLTLKDLSLKGTFVNNRKVELAALADRQTIRLGNTELVYHERR